MSSDTATPPPGDGVPVRVAVPSQLRDLARIPREAVVRVAEPVTLGAVLDALEAAHPPLAGTVRDRRSGHRRAMIRIYAAGEDYSDAPPDTALPGSVRDGREPLRLVGSIAGG
jgi:sulfur-carrier protein